MDRLGISPRQVAQIIGLRERRMIGSGAADELFGLMCDASMQAVDPETLARERGMLQIVDEGALRGWVDDAVAAQPQAAKDFAQGKDAALGRLVGHIMKVSKGRADARAAQEALRGRLRP
jgi:aspartyl-tRNA(Asn)/glutamyl-tRNA(Gln) amidotransferase subunit B